MRRPQPSRLEQLSMCLSLPISVVSLARAYHIIANDQIVCLCFSNGASLEDVESLKAVLVNSNIDSQCKQSNTIISKILEGIATRGVEITSTELHI